MIGGWKDLRNWTLHNRGFCFAEFINLVIVIVLMQIVHTKTQALFAPSINLRTVRTYIRWFIFLAT